MLMQEYASCVSISFLFLIFCEIVLLTWVQLSVSQLSVEVVASGDELIFHIALWKDRFS